MNKVKHHKLKEATSAPFLLVGISCHESDYRVSWAINNQLGIQLSRTLDHQVVDRDETVNEFPLFVYQDEENYQTWRLVANRCDNGFLLPEHKNMDYFLHIMAETDENFIEGLVRDIRSIEWVSAVFLMDTRKIKHLGRLLF